MNTLSKYGNFLISCVGAYDDSGIGTGGFVLSSGNRISVIDKFDCTGLYYFDGVYYRFIRSLKLLVGYNYNGICYSCSFPEVSDCHDIIIKDAEITFVSTSTNSILWYDFKGKLLKSKTFDGQGDAWHLNCLALKDDKMYVAAFGKFKHHREWNLSGCFGQGLLIEVEEESIELSGLNGPHQARYIDNRWIICDSHTASLRIYDNKKDYQSIELGGFTRGFAYNEDYLFIGVSANRKNPKEFHSKMLVLDRKSFEIIDSIEIPFPEIYDILLCDDSLAKMLEDRTSAFLLFKEQDIIKALTRQVEIGEEKIRILQSKSASSKKSIMNQLARILKKIKTML